MNLQLSTLPSELASLAKEWPLVFMFDLPPGAKIVVVGCYEGKSMDLLRNVYPDYRQLIGYDLQAEPILVARERFKYADYVYLYPFGLGTEAHNGKTIPAYYGSVNTTLMVQSLPRLHECDLVRADTALGSMFSPDDVIDLMVINIEGFEIELLPYLKDTGWLTRTARLAVQFHPSIVGMDACFNHAFSYRPLPLHKVVVDQFPQWVYWKK